MDLFTCDFTLFADTIPAEAEAVSAVMGRGMLVLLVTIFVLAVFVGVEIIAKIPPTLHTPLMSGSNAVSGITMIGAILEAGKGGGVLADDVQVKKIVVIGPQDRLQSSFTDFRPVLLNSEENLL